MLRQVVATFENTPSSERARYATSCHNLGLLYYRHSAYQDAEFLLKRALAIRENTLGPDHPLVALSLRSYALVLRKTGRSAQAKPLEKRGMTIRKKHSTENLIGLTVDVQSVRK